MIPIADTIRRNRAPVLTWALVLANVLIFAFEASLPQEELVQILSRFGVVPERYARLDLVLRRGVEEALPFFTSMFLHGGWLHLVSNMWTFWIFGDNVEDRMGHVRFLLFYVICGVAAGLVHLVTNPHSSIPAIGASGAIAGVLGAYLVLFPRARVLTLMPVFFLPLFIEVPAVFFLGIWFVIQFASGTAALASPTSGTGIAWWAHIGGFVVGLLLHPWFLPRRPRRNVKASQY